LIHTYTFKQAVRLSWACRIAAWIAGEGLWSSSFLGGEERQVPDSITETNLTVTSGGIYCVDFAVKPNAPKPQIR